MGTRDGSQLRGFEDKTSAAMIGVSLAVVPVWVAQKLAHGAGSWSAEPLGIVVLCIQIAMGLDVVIRTYLSPSRIAFLTSHKLDVLATIVPPVRGARELVAVRSILRRPGVTRFSLFSVTVIVGCALVVYAGEHDREGATITSVGDAFWWAAVTTTTVGYGDEVPSTDQGRLVAIVLMALGVSLVAAVTAHIAAHFVDDDRDSDSTELLERLGRVEFALIAVETQLGRVAPASDRRSTGQPHREGFE